MNTHPKQRHQSSHFIMNVVAMGIAATVATTYADRLDLCDNEVATWQSNRLFQPTSHRLTQERKGKTIEQ